MDWQTLIENVTQNSSGAAVVNVVFVNEIEGRKEARSVRVDNPTKGNIFSTLRWERGRLESFDGAKTELPIGVFVDIDADLPPPPPADAPNPARDAYLRKLSQFRELNALSGLGIIAADNADLMKWHDDLVSAYDPAYFGIGK